VTFKILADSRDRTPWLAARKHGIGSSDIAAVCGLSSWASPIDVWLEKTGRSQRGESDDLHFEIGRALEPLIADRYTRQLGEPVENTGKLYGSVERPWQLATPDRLRPDGKPVECKVSYTSDGWGEPGSDEVPQQYICQVQWQLDVLGQEFGHIAAIIGRSFRVYTVRYDADLCEALRSAAERFWNDYVLADVQPPVTEHERDQAYLQSKFNAYDAARIKQAEPPDDELATLYAAACAAEETAEREAMLYGNQLRERIGEAEGIDGLYWRATWKAPKAANTVDWEAVASELHPPRELIAKYTAPKNASRRFLFKMKGFAQ